MIAENGPDAFYKGAIADQIAGEMQKNPWADDQRGFSQL